MTQYECRHGVDDCAAAPSNMNQRKTVWNFEVEISEEYFEKHSTLEIDGWKYGSYQEFVDDYGQDNAEMRYMWRDRQNGRWFFCGGCHQDLMSKQIPTIVEDEELPDLEKFLAIL